jgi:hypothetical protein
MIDMQPGEALDVAAQVAVTLAGFAGVVVVFRPQSVHEWLAIDRLRLRLLLANSALPLVSSLFGILLLTIDPPPNGIWRWCSGFAFLTMVPFFASLGAVRRQISSTEFQTVSKRLYYGVSLLGTAAIALQAINIVRWNQFWPFFGGILFHLSSAIAQFIRFLLLPPHTSAPG